MQVPNSFCYPPMALLSPTPGPQRNSSHSWTPGRLPALITPLEPHHPACTALGGHPSALPCPTLDARMLWEITSKAFLKSRQTSPMSSPWPHTLRLKVSRLVKFGHTISRSGPAAGRQEDCSLPQNKILRSNKVYSCLCFPTPSLRSLTAATPSPSSGEPQAAVCPNPSPIPASPEVCYLQQSESLTSCLQLQRPITAGR